MAVSVHIHRIIIAILKVIALTLKGENVIKMQEGRIIIKEK